ncbi:MAG: hypothetical protein M9915_01225 [Rhizobacter sp.]|nr:hypothetical protein [Rhizobacter sp.]
MIELPILTRPVPSTAPTPGAEHRDRITDLFDLALPDFDWDRLRRRAGPSKTASTGAIRRERTRLIIKVSPSGS